MANPPPSTPPTLSQVTLQEIRRRLRKEKFETWFRGFQVELRAPGEVVCSAPNGFIRDWLVRHYLRVIEESVRAAVTELRADQRGDASLAAITPARVKISFARSEGASPSAACSAALAAADTPGSVACGMSAAGQGAAPVSRGAHEGLATIVESMAVEPEPSPATKSSESSRVAAPGAPLPGSAAGRATWSTEEAPLNRNYTFEQFVVGSCNRLAHAAALASSEQPGQAYNPLFVHGNVGLGKSHLLQAIGNAILRRSHEARLIYISCEEFTNRYIRSIESREVDRFRKYHRTADVLIVDDVDFLANKERTQEEFFHTFNDLYNAGKQIVLSSDRPPPEIPALEERLVSRFKWGLVVDIDRPCFETRVAILKRKAKMRSVELPDEVAYYVAKRIDTNIRELEGALIKLIGVAAITERVLSLNLAQEALHDVQPSKSYHVALTEIMSLITSEFAISARDITGKNRTQAISFPRQVGMYLSRMHTEHSLEEVGKFFGNRDHTTVLYAVTKIRERAQSDRVLKELLASLATRLIRR